MSESVYEPPLPPRTRRTGRPYALLLTLLACLALGAWTATQYVAYQFGFHADLGPVWFYLSPEDRLYLRAGSVLLVGTALSLSLFSRARRFAPVLLLASGVLSGLSMCDAVYEPSRYLRWALAYSGFDEATPYVGVFSGGLLAGGVALAASILAFLLLRARGHRLQATGSHGTAAWGERT